GGEEGPGTGRPAPAPAVRFKGLGVRAPAAEGSPGFSVPPVSPFTAALVSPLVVDPSGGGVPPRPPGGPDSLGTRLLGGSGTGDHAIPEAFSPILSDFSSAWVGLAAAVFLLRGRATEEAGPAHHAPVHRGRRFSRKALIPS